MVSFEEVRRWAVELPGVEAGSSYGTPALRVRGKFLARLREDEEEEILVLAVDPDSRDLLMQAAPETYYTTPHYAGSAMMLVRLAVADADELRDLLVAAWRERAPKRLIAEFDTRERSG